MLGYQAEFLIWEQHFAGNFSSQARVMGAVLSASGLFSFLLNPLLACASDTFGRKPLLLLGSASSLAKYLLIGLRPSVPSVAFGHLLVCTLDSWMLGTFAAAGDVHRQHPAKLALAHARLQMFPFVALLISPVVGGRLAATSARGPYLLASALYGLQLAAVSALLPETLPASERRERFEWSATSPLSVLELFKRGRRLKRLAVMVVLNEFASGRPVRMVCDTQKDEVLRWSAAERGVFNSFAGATTLPSFLGSARLIQQFGNHKIVALGMLGYVVELIVSTQARTQRAFYAARLLGIGSFASAVALSSQISVEAAEVGGMLQGELRGAIQNLQQLCAIIGPWGWGLLYSKLAARGQAHLLYFVPAVLALAVVAMVPGARLNRRASEGHRGEVNQ